MSNTSPTSLLLNVGHGLDHLFLLIFATAVAAIAAEWGMAWQDLMPYTVGAFVLFGLGSLPAGRLGDLWGRRAMMIVFFLGIGAAGLARGLRERAVVARRRAHADGRLRGDLSPGGDPDDRAGRDESRLHHRRERARRQSGHRLCGRSSRAFS